VDLLYYNHFLPVCTAGAFASATHTVYYMGTSAYADGTVFCGKGGVLNE
jgi:hypothetical protein